MGPHLREGRRRQRHVLDHQGVGRRCREQGLPSDQLVQDAAKGVLVGPHTDRSAFDLLGGHVAGGAHDVAWHGEARSGHALLGLCGLQG